MKKLTIIIVFLSLFSTGLHAQFGGGGTACPPSSPTSISATNHCGYTVLTLTDSQPDVFHYWQTSSTGTSQLDPGTTYTATSGTTRFVRAYNIFNSCWGPARSISYTINSGTVWYQDSDGDGLGDPTATVTQCTQPAGYVTNNSDQCPSQNGEGNSDGCPLTTNEETSSAGNLATSFSDENYIYNITPQIETQTIGNLTEGNQAIENISYMDGLGRGKQNIALRGGGISGVKNILDWRNDWTIGSGSTPFFNQNGATSENERLEGTDPFGETSLLWKCGNDASSSADGGWNTDYFAVNKTIGYRYAVWVKRVDENGNNYNNGRTYHGTQNVNNLNGAANGNPYFWSGDLPQEGAWYLLVGVIHPYNYSGGNTGASGVYDIHGNKVKVANEFKWRSNTTTTRLRSYFYYSTDTSVKQYFHNPVFEKLDGTESNFNDLIAGDIPNDIITPMEYDSYGRAAKTYLPYTANAKQGALHTTAMTEVYDYYNVDKYENTLNPYSESMYERSPLNRVLEQGAPGNTWKANENSNADHTIKFEYATNNSSTEVKYYEVGFTSGNTEKPYLQDLGHYPVKTLYKTVTKDENWKSSDGNNRTTIEFKDIQGMTLLKRTYNNNIAHDTYYVYDKFGNLTFVLPPKVNTGNGVSTTERNELCYQYKYDKRNRLVEKKIPGKGWEYIVYNTLNQPVLTQDPNLRAQNKWLFTKYDAFGRVAFTGFTNSSSGRVAMQDSANNTTVYTQYVTKQSSPITIGGASVYYTNTPIPHSIAEIHTINYYDNYTFDIDGLTRPSSVYGEPTITNVRSLPTGSKVRVLGTNDWITTITYYDEKSRPIQIASKNNYLDITDKVESKLDFVGRPMEVKTIHAKVGKATITTVDMFTYDHVGRLLTQQQQINNGALEHIVTNKYDDLGQLRGKNVGNTESTPLQEVDYVYNVRGWLKSINNVDYLEDDLFAFGLSYQTVNQGGDPLYNGNISETLWKTANDNLKRFYKYDYDHFNRLTSADNNSSNYHLQNVSYDKNGNITALNRKGHINSTATSFGTMDNLVYTYDAGNKLTKLVDNGNDTYGFKDGTNQTTEYVYDSNGNMTIDRNKGITGIDYNHLNLPTNIIFDNDQNKKITYVYDALGSKQKKIVNDIASNTETVYASNYVYENNSLQFFNTTEGYVEPNGNNWVYIYQHKDHLGNIRLSYADTNKDGIVNISEIREENNYYPFGLKQKGYNVVVNGRDHKFQYNSKELEEDLGKDLYAYGWRDYDPAIGRFNKIDRFAEKYQNLTPYNYAANNPIRLKDIKGDSISGVSRKDARRTRRLIRKTFKGSKNRKIRRLFKTKGKNFKNISKNKLAKATEGVDSKTASLARAYTNTINSENVHKVEVVKRGDKLSSFSQKKTALGFLGRRTANDVEKRDGGGVNAPLRNGGNLTIIVMDSKVSVPIVNSSTNSVVSLTNNIPSVLAHELLGHGVGRVLNSRGSEHQDAIQMENLSLHTQGLGHLQNNGASHVTNGILPLNIYSGIPTHFQQ